VTGARKSGLVVPMPDLDPIVGHLRKEWDPVAPLGVRAHVTVLFPFATPATVDDEVLDRIAGVVEAPPPFAVTFGTLHEFPDHVLYLAPSPAEPFRALTYALAGAFPDHPPYGGQFADVIPHLTVAHRADAPRARIREELGLRLPVTTTASVVELWVEGDDDRWTTRATFSLPIRP